MTKVVDYHYNKDLQKVLKKETPFIRYTKDCIKGVDGLK